MSAVRLPAALLLFAFAAVQAQPAAQVYRVGYVSTEAGPTFEAFRRGLRELGYIEGKNVLIEARFAEGHTERLPGLVAEVLARKVDVLLAGSPAGAVAAKKASTTVPIVFAGVGDPVTSGVVTSLSRPGGNITGVAVGVGGPAFGGKWLEALKEALPALTHVAVLANRSNTSNSPYIKGVEDSAQRLKMKVDVFDAGNDKELERALAAVSASGAQGMVVTTDPFLFRNRASLIRFAESRRLPAIYFFKLFTDAGGLMSYGASIEGSYQRAAVYVDRILKGAKPGDLPVEQPTRFELAINLKTAKTLGLRIPQSLLLRADHVIE